MMTHFLSLPYHHYHYLHLEEVEKEAPLQCPAADPEVLKWREAAIVRVVKTPTLLLLLLLLLKNPPSAR